MVGITHLLINSATAQQLKVHLVFIDFQILPVDGKMISLRAMEIIAGSRDAT